MNSLLNKYPVWLRDLLIAILLCYMYAFIRYHIIGGIQLDKWLLPLMDTFFFAIPCWIAYTLSIRLFESKILFMIMSWLLVAGGLFLSINSAQNTHLTLYTFGGYKLYDSGHITLLGIMRSMLVPSGAMAFWATFIVIRYYITSKWSRK